MDVTRKGDFRPPARRRVHPIPRQHDVREFLDQMKLARKRVGDSPIDRLSWIVSFGRRDLEALHPGELSALGYDLRALIPITWGYTSPLTALPDDAIRSIHGQVKAGLDALLKDGEWLVRISPRIVLRRDNDADDPTYQVGLSWKGTEPVAILGGVMETLLEVGDRLRTCPECQHPFVRRKRRAYCSVTCSQRTRDRRKREKSKS